VTGSEGGPVAPADPTASMLVAAATDLHAAEAHVAAHPDRADAYVRLAHTLYRLGQPERALAAIRQALAIDAHFAPAHFHAAQILTDLGAWEAARRTMDAAITLAPEWSTARYMRGLQRLTDGEWREGWADHEWRWRIDEYQPLVAPATTPRWEGEPIAGMHLLIDAEQGHGDTLQFARFVPALVARGARVTLRVHPALVSLLAPQLPATVLSIAAAPPPHDRHTFLLSLPHLLGLDHEAALGRAPYLEAPAPSDDARRALDTLLPADGRPSIGVVWSGRAAHPLNGRRSLPLSEIERLAAAHPHLRFVSLQRFMDDPSGGTAPAWLLDATPCCQDFAGMAQVMTRLEVLLTACTAPAHLGGALGVPTWVMLGHAPDWRWMRERTDSPWYDSVRLFRQTRPFDWGTVTDAISAALTQRFPHRP